MTEFCPDCRKPCGVRIEDTSFDYEYGSISGTRTGAIAVSDCCQSPFDDPEGKLLQDAFDDDDDFREPDSDW